MTKLVLRAVLAPFVLTALLIAQLVQLIDHRRRLTAAQAKLRANQAAYLERQAARPSDPFARHIAELRQMQGEDQ